MPKKNNPGCKCCGCVAVVGVSTCKCACRTPIPNVLHVEDGNGLHTMTNGSAPATDSRTVYDSSCNPDGTTLNYSYSLTNHCPDATFPNGYWQLSIGWTMESHCGTYCLPTNGGGAFTFQGSASATIPFTCDVSSLTFTLPTSVTFTCTSGSPGAFPVPGGGGTITVTP